MVRTRAVFQVCLAVTAVQMVTSTWLGPTVTGGVPRRVVPPHRAEAWSTTIQMSAAATTIYEAAFLFVVSKTPSELRMKTNATPTFVSDIDLSFYHFINEIQNTLICRIDGDVVVN